ncbi:conserved exported hypothetical protein [metagenome]|uniref:Uncharacterized protein n=1 Tax=metagenome TaxID=256318 RepID=A0A2P2CEJ5_9ZZZZ
MKKFLIAAGAAAIVASTGGLALANGGGNPQAPAGAGAETTPHVYRCDGGKTVNVRTRIVNTPFTFGETGDLAVPGAKLTFTGPRTGKDTVVVTFSGETRLFGAEADDWMGIEVKLDGVNIQPYTEVGDVMALASDDNWGMHSAQFCTKVGEGQHTLEVFTNTADFATDSSLSGWIDDYQTTFQRFK